MADLKKKLDSPSDKPGVTGSAEAPDNPHVRAAQLAEKARQFLREMCDRDLFDVPTGVMATLEPFCVTHDFVETAMPPDERYVELTTQICRKCGHGEYSLRLRQPIEFVQATINLAGLSDDEAKAVVEAVEEVQAEENERFARSQCNPASCGSDDFGEAQRSERKE